MITEFLLEAWFRLSYTIKEEDRKLYFDAFKITSICEENPKDSECEFLAEISGEMKWDGCLVFTQKSHYCGYYHAEQVAMLFKRIYEIAEENSFDI